MIARKLIYLLCAAPVLGVAQDQASVSGPIAGFVFDQSARAIRPMLGIPGAGYIGPAIATDVDAAGIAPDGSAALAVRQGQLYLAAPLKSLAPAWTAIDGAIRDVDHFAWSADGAAVYASTSGQAQILRDLAKTPAAGAAIDLSGLPGAVLALAVNGDDLLVGVDTSGVYRIHAGDAPQLVARAASPVALVIAGSDLYFADRSAGQVWQVPSFADGSTPVPFAGDIDAPVGIFLSGGRLFVASAGANKLGVYGLSTHVASATIDLAFTPSTLDPMGSRSLLLMASAQPNQPYYVLDTAEDPAVYFVPVGGDQQ